MTVRPSLTQRTEEGDEVGALHRVGAVQGLVEDEHLRRRDERGGDLRALAHALAEAADPTVGDVEQADGLERAGDRGVVRDPCSPATYRRAAGPSAPGAPLRPRAPARGSAGPRGRSADRTPRTRTAPVLGPTSPVMARMSVVLPAPFGPRRPVTPGPNEQLSSDRATLGPNHTERSRDLDRGVGHEGGIVRVHASGCR